MKILKKDNLLKILLIFTLMTALILGCVGTNMANNTISTIVNEHENEEQQDFKIDVVYNTHIQDYGWENDFSKMNGQESGTTGQNKKIEAIKIKLLNAPEGIEITYQSYLNGLGWESEWKTDGEISGTTGQNRKLEAIKIKLTGTENYSIEYKTHVQDIGWMDWVKDGEISGVVGKGLKIEAIEIRIIPKTMCLVYQSHVQDIGWEQYVNDEETSGTIGKGLKVEAVKIELRNTNINIKYQTHIQDIGWENDWKENGEQSGTTGRNLKIEAIKIKLDDVDYSVMYRSYLNGIGWQEWKKDGEISGTTGQNRKLEAIQIKIVEQQTSTEFTIRYQSHVQDIGWQEYVREGDTSGIEGKGLKVEAIKIIGKNIPENAKILYQTHIQDIGWETDWKENGEQSGTTGRNLKLEAIKIKLEGLEDYSIMYRTYVEGRGWQDWANDGEISGTTGKNLKLEAIEIKLSTKIKNKIQFSLDTNLEQETYPIQSFKLVGWLMTDIENVNIQVLVNDNIVESNIIRTERQDVLDAIKGYGGQDSNPKPGYEATINLSNMELQNINIKVQFVDAEGNVLAQTVEKHTYVLEDIKYQEGIYGKTGLKVAGRGGSDLKYLKFGNGENVFFGTFAIHGYEDEWDKDGQELIDIAKTFYSRLINEKDYDLAEKWTIYLFPGVNLDGLTDGYTNNGPGRTTLYSQADNNKGIDLNRCWQIGSSYQREKLDRYYNGTSGFQAYEAQYLRDFLLSHKSNNGQTILVDLHGWFQQLIGDPGICSYYQQQFPENNRDSVGRYGTQYLIAWARTYLGSNGRAARTALIELPKPSFAGHQAVVNQNFANRYIEATLSMLRSII